MSLDSSPRTFRFLPADILTSGYRVVGKIMVASQGAMGIMNDPTHSALEVNDARMARLHMPTKLVFLLSSFPFLGISPSGAIASRLWALGQSQFRARN